MFDLTDEQKELQIVEGTTQIQKNIIGGRLVADARAGVER